MEFLKDWGPQTHGDGLIKHAQYEQSQCGTAASMLLVAQGTFQEGNPLQ